MSLHDPDAEQAAAVAAAAAGHNVLVDAVPGAGKTTCVLHMAKALPARTWRLITYNRTLADETNARASALGLTNLKAYTFHGIASKLMAGTLRDDTRLRQALDRVTAARSVAARTTLAPVTDLVVDEAQDVRPLCFKLVCFLLAHSPAATRVHVLGDQHQSVYAGMEADARFLTLAPRLLDRAFTAVPFRTSYRLTRQMAAVVNGCMLGEARITAVKDGAPVVLWKAVDYVTVERLAHWIVAQLGSGALTAAGTFILAASVRKSEMCKRLENVLLSAGVPMHVPTSDDAAVTNTVARGKLVMTTFHQAKGRERDAVIVLGCDASYFTYFARDANPTLCPDTLHVAATRGLNRLVLVQTGPPPAFWDADAEAALCARGDLTIIDLARASVVPTLSDAPRTHKMERSVTDLCRFIKPSALEALEALATRLLRLVHEPTEKLEFPTEAPSTVSGSTEAVADVNGVAIVAAYEAAVRRTCTIYEQVRAIPRAAPIRKTRAAPLVACAAAEQPLTCSDFLRLATVYLAAAGVSGSYWHKLMQLPAFNWGTDADWHAALATLGECAPALARFEVPLQVSVPTAAGQLTVVGTLDAVATDGSVYEFKTTQSLTLEHKVQTLLYAFMLHRLGQLGAVPVRLLNVLTRECWELQPDYATDLQSVFDTVVANACTVHVALPDDDFVAENTRVRADVFARVATLADEPLADEPVRHVEAKKRTVKPEAKPKQTKTKRARASAKECAPTTKRARKEPAVSTSLLTFFPVVV